LDSAIIMIGKAFIANAIAFMEFINKNLDQNIQNNMSRMKDLKILRILSLDK